MCVLLFAWQAHPRFALVLAANRDEYYARPAAPAGFWKDAPHVLAGRDLEKGGTWLGMTTTGRMAALTNFRDPRTRRPDAPSRGKLVADYLRGHMPPGAYLQELARESAHYNDFCFIAGDAGELWYCASRSGAGHRLEPGVHGLSNHFIDTPWPKIQWGRQRLAEILAEGTDEEELFRLLRDDSAPPDEQLPDTGVGLEWERALAPLFVKTPTYGTRCSTLLLIGTDGYVRFVERTYLPDGRESTATHELRLEPRS